MPNAMSECWPLKMFLMSSTLFTRERRLSAPKELCAHIIRLVRKFREAQITVVGWLGHALSWNAWIARRVLIRICSSKTFCVASCHEDQPLGLQECMCTSSCSHVIPLRSQARANNYPHTVLFSRSAYSWGSVSSIHVLVAKNKSQLVSYLQLLWYARDLIGFDTTKFASSMNFLWECHSMHRTVLLYQTCYSQLRIPDFHYSREYANIRRILLVQFGKCVLNVLYTDFIAFSGIFALL